MVICDSAAVECRREVHMPSETIDEWLAEVGLPQYTHVFAENDIDLAVLPDLSAHDHIGLAMDDVGNQLRHPSVVAVGDAPLD